MSLSDCEKCWDTPCTCGWEYKEYSDEKLIDLIVHSTIYIENSRAIRILQEAKSRRELMLRINPK